eukprot:TRINITY_DN1185_c0_g1_i2.p1 TRINITY_DN1185_c0_g1~~TRINITY_DN1185_c0_g1_i2.p1  ORF type:complete len:237 (+),score=40.47 TRINITY_DN1185_c0_g1_i2:305-1015(+)
MSQQQNQQQISNIQQQLQYKSTTSPVQKQSKIISEQSNFSQSPLKSSIQQETKIITTTTTTLEKQQQAAGENRSGSLSPDKLKNKSRENLRSSSLNTRVQLSNQTQPTPTPAQLNSSLKSNILNYNNTQKIDELIANKQPISTFRKNQFSDIHINKIMDLSKQIDFLSQEYMKKGKDEAIQLVQERDSLKSELVDKIKKISELQLQVFELEKVQRSKEELQKQYQDMQEYLSLIHI